MNKNKILKVMKEAAKDAGYYIRKNYGKIKKLDYKGSARNLVTNVDKRSEQIVVKHLKKAFSNFDILAEESGLDDKKSDYKWIIDPLDGTTNFAHSFPHFSVSIALEYKKQIVAGVVYDVMRDEMFYAFRGYGAYLNKKKIRVSNEKSLAKSLLATGFAYDIRKYAKQTVKVISKFLIKAQEIRRAGSAALDLCYIACGRFEGYWERGLAPWDTAAGYIIVEEAGGKVTDFCGNKFDYYGKQVLASNKNIHSEMIKILAAF
ncbi:inositol monophosphatase family protein [bacterium]